ncbi:thiamine transporter 1-like [Selaginella moellendorffii]|uniref:thiamine transporter 1-like n=1 Tax=Selaginella moellendorffii TaxID=88036 RepID=UPI000D1CC65D|nr:thiamine transporter 1-like [Selaginella moellendorffii]|eukprot:XP_024533258.1 thiamine transporter 1-like [Selaginella moellendorffii]
MEEERGGSDGGLRGSAVALMCVYAFCLQFTPSEPYLVPFLTKVKGFSNNVVTTEIFPVSVYSTLVFTLLAAPACTYLKYRSVILIGTLGRLSTFFILLFGRSLLSMQLMQATYALGVASDLVFSSYLFVLVKENMYQSLTSFTQASSTFSFFIAAELSQLLVSEGVNLIVLLYISTCMVALALVACVFLPVEMRHWIDVSSLGDLELDWETPTSSCQNFVELVKATWSNRSLQLLSLWWAFQLGGTAMIENYGTNLFDAVDPTSIYNGHVIAATQGASCVAALIAVPASRYTSKAGGLLYAGGSGLTWLLCVVLSRSKSLWIVHAAYILCVALNKFLLCILYVQCARFLSHGHFIFLFSLNAVAALLVQSSLQAFVEVLNANLSAQFYYVGNYFLVLTIVFAVLVKAYYQSSNATLLR